MFEMILGVKPDPVAGSMALGAMFVCLCIFGSVFISNRKSRRELELNHKLAELHEENLNRQVEHKTDTEHEENKLKISAKRDVDLTQITEKSLLVSHQREEQRPG